MQLELIDTVVAFVTILLGVSLLIMILTQAVASLLNLRGRSLLYGISTLLETTGIDLAAGKREAADRARGLGKKILRDQLISDSWFKKPWLRRMASVVRKEELEVILTRLVQEGKGQWEEAKARAEEQGRQPEPPGWMSAVVALEGKLEETEA